MKETISYATTAEEFQHEIVEILMNVSRSYTDRARNTNDKDYRHKCTYNADFLMRQAMFIADIKLIKKPKE